MLRRMLCYFALIDGQGKTVRRKPAEKLGFWLEKVLFTLFIIYYPLFWFYSDKSGDQESVQPPGILTACDARARACLVVFWALNIICHRRKSIPPKSSVSSTAHHHHGAPSTFP